MSGGGIIIQQARVMLQALNDPSLWNQLPQHCRDKVNAIDAKAELSRDEHDVRTLALMFPVAVTC